MKKMYFFNRLMAVMLIVTMLLPQSAVAGLVIPEGLPQEDQVTDFGTFNVGQMITDHPFWNKVFHSRPEAYNNHRVNTLGNLPPTMCAKTGIEQWRLDTICCLGFEDAEINAIEYIFNEDSTAIVKQINHSIVMKIKRENYVVPGPYFVYGEAPEGTIPDPAIVHDTIAVYDESSGGPGIVDVWFMFYYVKSCSIEYDDKLERNVFRREWASINSPLEQEHSFASENDKVAYVDPTYRSIFWRGFGDSKITVSCQEVAEKHMAQSVDFILTYEPKKDTSIVIVSEYKGGTAMESTDIILDMYDQHSSNTYYYVRVENEWGFKISDPSWKIASSDESVAIVEKDDDEADLFKITPVKQGTATLAVTYAGDETYMSAVLPFTVNIVDGKLPTGPRELHDALGNPVEKYEATEGDIIDDPELVHPTIPGLSYTRFQWFGNTSKHFYWEMDAYDHIIPGMHMVAAGEDTLRVVYASYEDGPYDTILVPIHIKPYVQPIPTGTNTLFDFSSGALSEDQGLIFKNSLTDKYNEETKRFEISTAIEREDFDKITEKLFAGSVEWFNALPGALAFNLEPGTGKICIEAEVTEMYKLDFAFRSICKTFHVEMHQDSENPNIYWIEYDTKEPGVMAIFIAPLPAMNAPARAAKARKDKPAIKGSIKSIALDVKDVPTAIDQIHSSKMDSQKLIKDGQIVILRGGKIFTLTGQKVR